MFKYNFIFQLAVLIFIPSLTFSQNMHIRIFNKTGYNLDSVWFENYNLGKIDKDSSVFLSEIYEFTVQNEVPQFQPLGIIKEKKSQLNLKSCSSKSKKITSGSYSFDILIKETEKEYMLYWKKHD